MIGSVSNDCTIRLWCPYTGKALRKIRASESFCIALDFSETGKYILTGGMRNTVFIHDVYATDNKPKHEVNAHWGYISCAKFLGDKYTLSGSGDCTLFLSDINQNAVIQKYKEHTQDVTSISLSSDKNTFLSSSCDCMIKLWDLRSAECVHTYSAPNADVDRVDYHQSGYMFCYSCADSTAVIEIRAQATLGTFTLQGLECRVSCMSKSGRLVFSGHMDGSLCVWDLYKQKMIQKLNRHENNISGMELSPNGQAIVTSSWDGSVKLYY
jgi:guanine nucleotide-binding protein G(I)/G(S)/G(T) subunit beta-1